MGLGKKKEVTLDRIRQAMGSASKKARQTGAQMYSAPIMEAETLNASAAEIAQAMIEGAILGNYRFNYYRSEDGDSTKNIRAITLLANNANQVNAIKAGTRRGEASGQATSLARDLCNHPANIMTPTRIVQEAKKIAKEGKVKLTVLERKDQEKLGMGGLLGVSQGSQEAAKFLILEYFGGKKKDAPIVLVG